MEDKQYFRPTIINVDLLAIKENVANLRKRLHATTQIMAVVKANAYGHGSIEVAKAALEAGATILAVATPEESLHIRAELKNVPILILGATPISFIPVAAEKDITLTVFSTDWVQLAEKQGFLEKPVNVHMKIDSGMGRIGVREPAEMLALYEAIQASPQLQLDGVFTHFATADEESSTYYEEQKEKFIKLIGLLPEKPRLVHAANTAASLVKDGVEFDAVRFGISMYGLSPSSYIESCLPFPLHAAMELVTELVHVKQLHKGDHVGYGATYTATEDNEWIGTLPIGYADGLRRALQGQEVLVRGEKAPIVGRVCMDQVMIKLPFEMAVGEKVTLIGKQGEREISMQQWADRLNTIVYEIPCMLTSRITRVYQG